MSRHMVKDDGAEVPAIVAIIGSAVRLDPLRTLLAGLPPQDRAAIVIVLQHREALDEGLIRAAAAEGGHELVELGDGALVEAGRVYVPPAAVIATLAEGHFRSHPTEQLPTARGTIDSFLISLAQAGGGRAIVVALDGTDGDGTLGVREVKEAGGLVLAEAVAPGEDLAASDKPAALADEVLPADQLAPRIAALVEQVAEAPDADSVAVSLDSPATREALAIIASILGQRTGHDFQGYKPGTFLRRVQRRCQALQVDGLQAYIEVLRAEPGEAQELFNDLLIGVTEFFRDMREWELLEREVIPRLFEGKTAQDHLRLWVVGCSTGEEAYSLAILLRERMAQLDTVPQVQIFASDLDGRALAAARAGRYTEAIARTMSPERLGRWFVREGDTYHITKELREMCIFSQHSLIKDAPFSRIDLVSCRNLLIYLDADLQERVIPLFHFALRPGGFLFLGNSENVSRHGALFEAVAPRSRIFRRLEAESRALLNFPFTPANRRVPAATDRQAPAAEIPRPDAADLTRWAERAVERHSPAWVIVDNADNVVHFAGQIGRFLAPSRGAASLNLVQLVHPHLRLELRGALAAAAEKGGPVEVRGVEFGTNGGRMVLDLVVEPRLTSPGHHPAGHLVIFKDRGAFPDGDRQRPATPADDQSELVRRLEDELRVTRDRLQATIEELESTNEELKSSNEEYQSLNEELQSANEELETSKEELQSVNEELTTVNGELGHRVQELGRANSDLKNFLESTQIATLFLDNDLRVTNFTPAILDLFPLIDSDEGRPIAHIKGRIAYDEIQDDARRVLRTLTPAEREVGDPATGAQYAVRVLPYRSTDNVIAGVVITFVDVTARRQMEERLRESEALQAGQAEAFQAALSGASLQESLDALLGAASTRFGDVRGAFYVVEPGGATLRLVAGMSERYAQDVNGFRIGTDSLACGLAAARGQPVITPDVREEPLWEPWLWMAEAHGYRGVWSIPVLPSKGPALGTFALYFEHPRNATEKDRAFADTLAKAAAIIVSRHQEAEDRARAETALRESEEQLRAFGEASSDVLWIRNAETLAWEYLSPAFERVYGLSRDEVLRGDTMRNWLDLVLPEDRERAQDALEKVRQGEPVTFEYRITRPLDGEVRLLRDTGFPIRDAAGRITRIGGVGHDATEEQATAERLKVLVLELQHRTRNLMGVVRSVTDRTLAGAASLDDFQDRIRDRLSALARVNGLLSRLNEGDRISFDALLRTELKGHGVIDGHDHGPQVNLQGPGGIRLRSSQVQTLALGLHELATNALKHGALSQPSGRLDVSWRLVPGADGQRLRVEWRESGLPVAAPDGAPAEGHGEIMLPRPRGYGRELLERALPYQLGAETAYELTADGVRCTITLPLSSIQGEGGIGTEDADA